MKTGRLICSLVALVLVGGSLLQGQQTLRPPAVPLVAHDPYFSIWSCGDELAGDWPRHWTGAVHALSSMIRVDEQTFRLMGLPVRTISAAQQISLEVLPTRTIYRWHAGGVEVTLTFTTPVLPTDLDLVSRPVTYLTWTVHSIDGRDHAVQIYYDNSAELVVNTAEQPVTWSRPEVPGLEVLQIGSQEQPVLAKDGDDLRIDWGYLYVAAAKQDGVHVVVAPHERVRQAFLAGDIPDRRRSAKASPRQRRLAGLRAARSIWARVARRTGQPLADAGLRRSVLDPIPRREAAPLVAAQRHGSRRATAGRRREYAELVPLCESFDKSLMPTWNRSAAGSYAQLCALAYRQAIAAHKLAAGPATAGRCSSPRSASPTAASPRWM